MFDFDNINDGLEFIINWAIKTIEGQRKMYDMRFAESHMGSALQGSENL